MFTTTPMAGATFPGDRGHECQVLASLIWVFPESLGLLSFSSCPRSHDGTCRGLHGRCPREAAPAAATSPGSPAFAACLLPGGVPAVRTSWRPSRRPMTGSLPRSTIQEVVQDSDSLKHYKGEPSRGFTLEFPVFRAAVSVKTGHYRRLGGAVRDPWPCWGGGPVSLQPVVQLGRVCT